MCVRSRALVHRVRMPKTQSIDGKRDSSLTVGSALKCARVSSGHIPTTRAQKSERAKLLSCPGDGTGNDGRQTRQVLLMVDDETERWACFSAELDARAGRVGPSGLEARPIERTRAGGATHSFPAPKVSWR